MSSAPIARPITAYLNLPVAVWLLLLPVFLSAVCLALVPLTAGLVYLAFFITVVALLAIIFVFQRHSLQQCSCQAEEALVREQQLIRQALRVSEDDLIRAQAVGRIGSWRLDVWQNRLTWSEESYRIFGVPVGEPLTYEMFMSCVHPEDRDYVDRMWALALAGAPYSIEHRLLINGQVKWVLEKAELEFDEQGGLRGGFGIVQDITPSQLIKMQLEEANNRIAAIAGEQAAHLRDLSGKLLQAEEQERDRLYELLHDHVQPLLVATRLGLSGLGERTPPEEMLRVVSDAKQQISQVIETARTLSVELNPPQVREGGLVPGLESLCRRVALDYGLTVHMSSAPSVEPESMTVRLLCFKVVRELLMNIVKHAGTHEAFLELEAAPGNMLRICVGDNGAGFDESEVHDGSGLASIERRLGMIGGCLYLESKPGKGATATVFAPLGLGPDLLEPSSFL